VWVRREAHFGDGNRAKYERIGEGHILGSYVRQSNDHCEWEIHNIRYLIENITVARHDLRRCQ
jgi:hypothetical protein